MNVKAIEYIEGSSSVVSRSAKPNFKRLGKRLGRLMKGVNEQVRALPDAQIEQYLDEGRLVLDVGGEAVELGPEDLEIQSAGIEGWLVGQEPFEGVAVTVALDTTLTDDLVLEGLAREAVNRIQHLRKAADFEVTDRIEVAFEATPKLAEALRAHSAWVRNETLALALEATAAPDGVRVEAFEIGEERLVVGVRRVSEGASDERMP